MAKVTLQHLRELEYCLPQVRRFCREHGFQMREFRDGVEAERLRATGHYHAIKAAEHAEAQDAGGDA